LSHPRRYRDERLDRHRGRGSGQLPVPAQHDRALRPDHDAGLPATSLRTRRPGGIRRNGGRRYRDGLPEVRNGYEKTTVRFTIKGDAPAGKLREIVEQSRARSAVYDVITNGVPVTIEVDTP
jgi:hypothetical protein